MLRLLSTVKANLCEVTELSTNAAIHRHSGLKMLVEHDTGFFTKKARATLTFFGGQTLHGGRFISMFGD
ncbi:MAG: hypothetical protein CBC09_08865 [Cellvibrionales bacterium TMED49]|nr:MAG: hypothetical protein CBC09_08865 [Cellvibrionales bacterium TMED49]